MPIDPTMVPRNSRRGSSLIDLLIALGILAMLFAGIYLVYFSVLNTTGNIELRTAAASVLNQQAEIIRNLPYDNVGVVGGIPAGILAAQQTIAFSGQSFVVNTTVRNIDDPFDGTAGGSPNDTMPADYKLVALDISCPACPRFVPLSFSMTVAPKALEASSTAGSLFVNVFDANGIGVAGATVHVTNASTTPTINLTDVTNGQGSLQLVGVPTSTLSYAIQVSKNGYSSDQTYAVTGQNPNPTKVPLTVAATTVTNASFNIDHVSRLSVLTSDALCAPSAAKNFSLAGAKLIGLPNLLKFSTSSVTDASGIKVFTSLEWDTYSPALNEPGLDLLGTVPLAPFVLNPSASSTFRFVVQPALPNSLLIAVKDPASGQGIQDAQVTLSGNGVNSTKTSGHLNLAYADWSGSTYSAQSGGIDADSIPGSLTLLANASGTYPGGLEWLTSKTIDLGGASSTVYTVSFGGVVPAAAGPQSIKLQLAANNDGTTWNYAGPDGTANTYYTAASSPAAGNLAGQRYLRYKVLLSTADTTVTPRLTTVSLDVHGPCVPSANVLFNNLASGNYSLSVDANGYPSATSTVSISGAWQQIQISL